MKYFDLINKCLVELNYKQVNSFSEMVKNDHNKIKNIINVINREVCSFEKWNFLLRETELTIPAGTGQITNPIEGRIASIIIGGKKYNYLDDFEKFFTNSQPKYTYTAFNDKLLFPVFKKEQTAKVVYYTSNTATDSDGKEKNLLENEGDESLIPKTFAEPILVYGSCMRLKGNPQHVRFSYWYGMYKDALSNMKAKLAVDANSAPVVNLFRA